MNIEDLPAGIGGELIEKNNEKVLKLPYFKGFIFIGKGAVSKDD